MESQKTLPFYHGFMVVNYYLLSNVNLKTTTTLSLYLIFKLNSTIDILESVHGLYLCTVYALARSLARHSRQRNKKD